MSERRTCIACEAVLKDYEPDVCWSCQYAFGATPPPIEEDEAY